MVAEIIGLESFLNSCRHSLCYLFYVTKEVRTVGRVVLYIYIIFYIFSCYLLFYLYPTIVLYLYCIKQIDVYQNQTSFNFIY